MKIREHKAQISTMPLATPLVAVEAVVVGGNPGWNQHKKSSDSMIEHGNSSKSIGATPNILASLVRLQCDIKGT